MNTKDLYRHCLFPMILISVLATILLLWKLNYSPSQWIEYTYNGTALTLILLEFIIPRNKQWNYITPNGFKLRETSVEAFFFFFSGFFAGAVTWSCHLLNIQISISPHFWNI